jgi:pilus assembly protein Flp/PilA
MRFTETNQAKIELPCSQTCLLSREDKSFLEKILNDEEGQDMVEYGLVIALVVMGAVVALGNFDRKITNALGTLGNAIAGVTNF